MSSTVPQDCGNYESIIKPYGTYKATERHAKLIKKNKKLLKQYTTISERTKKKDAALKSVAHIGS